MALDRIRQFLFGKPPDSPACQIEPADQQQVELVAAMAQRMIDVVNESIQIAGHSQSIETRRSRVCVAREHIAQLQDLAADHPFIKIERLADVEVDLSKIDQKTNSLCHALDEPSALKGALAKNSRLVNGVRFLAEPRMTTPLSALIRHGELRDIQDEMPAIAGGHWSPKLKTFREIGLDIDEPYCGIGATDVGAVNVDRYIEFLIALKQAATSSPSIDECALAVDAICEQPESRDYVEAHDGARTMIERIFPTVLEMLDFIPALIRSDMAAAGLTTVERIGTASDASLLAIAGLGQTRLRKLRAWCRDFQGDRHSSRLAADNAARLRGWEW